MKLAALAAVGLVLASGGAARAEPLGACIWSKLSVPERARVVAAYRQDMAAGADALQKLDVKVRSKAAACAGRRDIPPLWIQTIAGAAAVQESAAAALLAAKTLDRARLDSAWAAAPADVAACVRANAVLAFFPNRMGCGNPAAASWLDRRLGIAPGEQPIARQALYYFNAKAIGEWGDGLVAKLAVKPAP